MLIYSKFCQKPFFDKDLKISFKNFLILEYKYICYKSKKYLNKRLKNKISKFNLKINK